MFIDTHCHIHDPEYHFDPEQTLAKAHYANVKKIIVIGTSPANSALARHFAQSHADVYYSYGYHPGELTSEQNFNISDLGSVSKRGVHTPTSSPGAVPATREDGLAHETSPKIRDIEVLRSGPVAIGEIGLDYHYQPFDRQKQIAHLEEYLQISKKLDLPAILHVREAFPDLWGVLDNSGVKKAVLHSFAGTKQNLEKALDRNLLIGVNGLATFAKIPIPPLESILLETDAPYLTPAPFRGKINEPAYIPEIATWVANHFGTTLEKVAKVTTANAERFFHI